jgi:type I restriction enzyme S subunit
MKAQFTQQEQDYRETELGLLPKKWEVRKIKDLAEVKYGKSNPRDSGSIPVVGSSGVFSYTSKPLMNLPTIVIGRKGNAGKVWLFLEPCFPSDTTFYLEWKEKVDVKYLFRYLTFRPLSGEHAKTTVPSLTRPDLENQKVPLPPIHEQEKIVFVLSTIQSAREKTETVINSLRELKKSLMKHLFTYGAVSPENSDKVKTRETESGVIPEGWKFTKLGEICTYRTGKLNSEASTKFGKYPFFTCSQETSRIDTYSFDQEALLLAGNNARGIYSVKYYNGKFDAYQRTYILTIKNKEQVNYKYLLFELTRKLETLRKQSLGSTTKYLTAGIITELDILIPPKSEQEQIALILSSVNSEIESEERRKESLDELFKSMLHDLMSARIRVNNFGG